MEVLITYLKPYRGLIFVALMLAGAAQVLTLYDPIILGKIIDDYMLNPNQLSQDELVKGVTFWMLVAIGVGLVARLFSTFKEYYMRQIVQKFGMEIFNDGLRQTLRLPYTEFEEQSSGEILAVLQKVRGDTERFINSFINILFSSVVGIKPIRRCPCNHMRLLHAAFA